MPESLPPPRSLSLAVLRAILRAVAMVPVVIYVALDEVLFPLFRPLIRWLSGFRVFEAIAAVIDRSPPYLVLLFLAVPFVLVEPLKVFAIYWGAVGHPIQGVLILLLAQVASILTLDRIYHAGKGQLHKIGWFHRLMTWVIGLRDKALGWAKTTAVWQATVGAARAVRAWFIAIFAASR